MSDTDKSMSISPESSPIPPTASLPPANVEDGTVTFDGQSSQTISTSKASPKQANMKKRAAKVQEEGKDGNEDEDDEGAKKDGDGPKKKKVKVMPKSVTPKSATPKSTTPKSATPATGRQRKAPANKPAEARIIARNYEDCSEADKKLIDLRDGGVGWDEIGTEIGKLTGKKPAKSTLPNRYSRLKTNLTVIKEEDHAILLQAKVQVEVTFEKEKWNLIGEAMKKIGTELYGVDALRKQYKKMMAANGIAPPPEVKSKDFERDEDNE